MNIEVFNPTSQQPIRVTNTAIDFFKKKLKNQAVQSIRISVKTSGCAGYSYVIDYGEQAEKTDSEHNFDGVRIFISEQAMNMIVGSEIDLKQEGLNKSIVFNNPNVTASCGCGTSFTTE